MELFPDEWSELLRVYTRHYKSPDSVDFIQWIYSSPVHHLIQCHFSTFFVTSSSSSSSYLRYSTPRLSSDVIRSTWSQLEYRLYQQEAWRLLSQSSSTSGLEHFSPCPPRRHRRHRRRRRPNARSRRQYSRLSSSVYSFLQL